MDGTGTFEMLQAQTAALVESARKRGMSAAAIARLPKAIAIKSHVLPPVVLATNPDRRSGKPGKVRPAIKYPKRSRKINARLGRHEATDDDRLLFRRICTLAEQVGGVPAAEIKGFRRARPITFARNACWRLFREFSGLSAPAMARITGRLCHTSILEGIAASIRHDKLPERVAFYWSMRTLITAAGHHIVEDLGKKARRA